MIDLSSFRGKRFAILGLGRTGSSAAKALLQAGATIAVWDDETDKRQQAVGLPLVDLSQADLSTFDYLLISPGIPHTFPSPHPVAVQAREAGVQLICDIELLCKACPQRDMIAVTGTNGKSTTTALIGHILNHFRVAEVGGNIGKPALELIDPGIRGTFVLELSSYQLELTPSLSPSAAVLLNITPDHLERHGGFEGYCAAKEKIFERAGLAVICIDTDICRRIAEKLPYKVIRVSTEQQPEEGVFVREGILYEQGSPQFDLRHAPALKGRHNHENAACAYAAVRAVYGYDSKAIEAAIHTFPGLPHRQFTVRTLGGVTYVNDSKATNADAAARALACYDDIYWILGGLPKEGGLSGLEAYCGKVRHAFLIGQAAPAFALWLEAQGIPYTQCGTLERAVAAAHDAATAGTVLLSPACASWDQFRSFEHRGEVFTALVNALPEVQAR